MTLPALLSKMSRRTPRFVTVNGMVLSGDDTIVSGSTGHTHPDHGRVTPVQRHTNHGGDLPNEKDTSPWWIDDEARLNEERMAMSLAFPGFVELEVGGRPAWFGEINTGRGTFTVGIVHRPDHGLPAVIPSTPGRFRRREGRRVRRSPHLYLNGNLCVAGQDDWNPERDDATTVIAWSAHWLAAFTEWRITGRWPCEGVDVDAA